MSGRPPPNGRLRGRETPGWCQHQRQPSELGRLPLLQQPSPCARVDPMPERITSGNRKQTPPPVGSWLSPPAATATACTLGLNCRRRPPAPSCQAALQVPRPASTPATAEQQRQGLSEHCPAHPDVFRGGSSSSSSGGNRGGGGGSAAAGHPTKHLSAAAGAPAVPALCRGRGADAGGWPQRNHQLGQRRP